MRLYTRRLAVLIGTGVLLVACASGRTVGDDPDASGGDDGVDTVDAPPRIDADIDAPPHIDAAYDARVDARVDAAGCTVMNQQQLTNPNLDQNPAGIGWVQELHDPGYPLIGPPPTGVTPVNPPYLDWQGGWDEVADDRLYQDVTIPASATAAELRLSRWIGTDEVGPTPYDRMWVRIRNPSDGVLATLAVWSNVDASSGWVPVTLPLPSAYAGQTIRVSFETSSDLSYGTGFLLDSIRLVATVCN